MLAHKETCSESNILVKGLHWDLTQLWSRIAVGDEKKKDLKSQRKPEELSV